MKGEKTMARVPMVTRTITVTKITALCLNIETAEPFNKTVMLSGTFNDEKSMMKAAEKILNTETERAVHIVSTEEIETLYGMTEQEFIQKAQVLPPRIKKKNQNSSKNKQEKGEKQ